MLKLTKGGNLNLTKDNASLRVVNFALGWSPSKTSQSFDLDAFVICARGNSPIEDDDVLYYNSNKVETGGKMVWADTSFKQPYIHNKALVHSGDELQGGRDGDDEVITIDLSQVPAAIDHIAFCVDIFQGASKNQSFQQVNNAFIRLDDASNSSTIAQYDLNRDAGASTGVVMGYLKRVNSDWEWKTVGQGFSGDMNDFLFNIHRLIGIKR